MVEQKNGYGGDFMCLSKESGVTEGCRDTVIVTAKDHVIMSGTLC